MHVKDTGSANNASGNATVMYYLTWHSVLCKQLIDQNLSAAYNTLIQLGSQQRTVKY